MDKWFKSVISIAVLMVGVSIAYYFFVFLPKTNSEKEIHRRVIECREMAEKLEKEIHPPGDGMPNGSLAAPFEYHYNAKMNKCFYCGGFNTTTGENLEQYLSIIDVYNNKELYNYAVNLKIHSETEDDIKYKKIKAELFEEKLDSE